MGIKNCLFGATNIVKNNDKGKYVYRDYGIVFDGADWWSFGNDFAGTVVIFGIDNSSSSHADNRKNNFSVLGKELSDDITGRVCVAAQKFSIIFIKARTKLCLSLLDNYDNSYLLVNNNIKECSVLLNKCLLCYWLLADLKLE